MARHRDGKRKRFATVGSAALACGASIGLAIGLAMTPGVATAQSDTRSGSGLGGEPMRRPPSGTGLGPGSGISSEPPNPGIAGQSSGSAGSSGGQGTSGGNMESGGGRHMGGPTGSGAPGTGPGSSTPKLGGSTPQR